VSRRRDYEIAVTGYETTSFGSRFGLSRARWLAGVAFSLSA
jgi:hypothetical protein